MARPCGGHWDYKGVYCPQLLKVRQELLRIDRGAVFLDFKVKMVAGGSTGAADFSDEVAAVYVIAHIGDKLAAVGIKSFVAILVIDYYRVAVAALPAAELNDAAVRR